MGSVRTNNDQEYSRKKNRTGWISKKFRKIIFKPLTASKLNLSSELNDDAQI